MKESEEIKSFLEKYKSLVGLSEWSIIVEDKYLEGENYAEVVPDIYEKTLTITLYKGFKRLGTPRKKSILIHELLHGRYQIFKEELEVQTNYLEEQYINDLERGIMKFIGEDK